MKTSGRTSNRKIGFTPVENRKFDFREFRGLTAQEMQSELPLIVGEDRRRGWRFWCFDQRMYYTEDFELTAADVRALANEQVNRRRLKLERAHALQAMSEQMLPKNRRAPIPQEVKTVVWQRDAGRCVDCSSRENLEFDHVIPHSMGGADTARNLQLLCEDCNRRKGASLG